MDILADLRAVRDLLTDPKKWIKGSAAKDQLGQPCPSRSPNATAWCLWGAGRKIAHGRRWTDLDSFLGKQFGTTDKHLHYSRWNDKDSTEHKDVIWFLEDAINEAKRRT